MNRYEYNKTIFNLNIRTINIAFVKPFIKQLVLMIFFSVIYFLLFNRVGKYNNLLLGIITLIVFLFGGPNYKDAFYNGKMFVSTVYMESLKYKMNVGSEYFDYMMNVIKTFLFLIDNKLYYFVSLFVSYTYMIILKLYFK